MEKYRQFADGGTSVNPFLPPWAVSGRSNIVFRALKFLLMFPIGALRMLLLGFVFLWLALVQLLCGLIPVAILRAPLYQFLMSFGGLAGLLTLGVIPLGSSLADHRRLRIATAKGDEKMFDARRGELIVVNQQGLTDVFYLIWKFCPAFVFVATDGTPVEYSLFGAIFHAGARRQTSAPKSAKTLAEISEKCYAERRPVAVFPEGARTNGLCVLSWKAKTFKDLETVAKPYGTALLSIEYSKRGAYTPHHTVGTAFRHLFWLCMQPWHTVFTMWLPAKVVGMAMKEKSLTDQVTFLRKSLVTMLPGSVEVEVGGEKHVEFMAYWDASQRKGYTSKKKT